MKRLEVHTHSWLRGGHYRGDKWSTSITHSHEGGDVPHQHEGMGPASYTIDKDDWFRSTGLTGGGRKKFTTKPSGEQFDRVELEPGQGSFRIIVDEESCRRMNADGTTGAGDLAAFRMVLGFGMHAEVEGAQ